MPSTEMITFPPGVLGDLPMRLPLVARTPDYFAVSKPAGVAVSPDRLWADTPNILEAIRASLQQGKRQLSELGINYAGSVHTVDVEMTGVAVFAASEEAEARLRNAAGSRKCEFVFVLVAEAGARTDPVTCDLPLAKREDDSGLIVSHHSGKKCSTLFTPVRRAGRYMLWEACTRENRPHQVRLHASECGLCIPGERRYGRVPLVYLSGIKRNFRPGREEEQPLHGPICVHLREVRLPNANGSVSTIATPVPKTFATLLKRLEHEE